MNFFYRSVPLECEVGMWSFVVKLCSPMYDTFYMFTLPDNEQNKVMSFHS